MSDSVKPLHTRISIPHRAWSRRWAWCNARWAEACAVWLSVWKENGSARALASAVRFAMLHRRGLQRWMAACTREGWQV